MKKVFFVPTLLIALAAITNMAYAQKPAVVTSNEPGWHKIGEISASFKTQTESIVVLGADEFTSLKLRVTDAPININRLTVSYESGEVEDIDVRNELQAGSETRVINLKNSDKDISKVTFTYNTQANYKGEKATVVLYGLKTASDAKDGVEKKELKEDAEKTESDIEKGAEKAGDKISETAAKGAAHVKDKVYVDKTGPDGQTVYIDKHSKYYYINSEGKKVYVTKMQLKDKPDNK
jgi:hypothetical protein